MTKDEFERAYAQRSGVTVEWLHSMGRWAESCECGADCCEGWAMGHQLSDLRDEIYEYECLEGGEQ